MSPKEQTEAIPAASSLDTTSTDASIQESNTPEGDIQEGSIQEGSIIEGTIISVTSQQAEVDLGDGVLGVLSNRHYTSDLMVDLKGELKVGDTLEAAVLIRSDQRQRVVLSRIWARKQLGWERVLEAKKTREVVTAVVVESIRGGLAVEIDEVRGFVPSSLLSKKATEPSAEPNAEQTKESSAEQDTEQTQTADKTADTQKGDWKPGQTISGVIIEIRQRKSFVMSHRAAVRREQAAKAREDLEKLNVGDEISGEVAGLEEFGAFIDIGGTGTQGLLRRREMSWNHAPEPDKFLSVGEKIRCWIEKVSPEKQQVSLTLKNGQNPIKELKSGSYLTGKIERLVFSGVIVSLPTDNEAAINETAINETATNETAMNGAQAAGDTADTQAAGGTADSEAAGEATTKECLLHGFVHIDEMSEHPVRRPQNMVIPGEEVAVKVIEVDPGASRVELSIIDAIVPETVEELG